MKALEFKKLIKEAVREVIKEELGDLLKSESTTAYKPSFNTESSKTSYSSDKTVNEMLELTRQGMTRDDFRNIVGQPEVKPGLNEMFFDTESLNTPSSVPNVGLDISKLGFVKNANATFRKSLEIDKNR